MTAASRFLPGLCSITFRELTVEEVVRMASAEQTSAIEWGGDVHVPAGNGAKARAVSRLCSDAGILCPSYGSYVRAGAADERQDFAAVLDTAQELGASNIRVWAGDAASVSVDGDGRQRTTDRLRTFAESAAACGLTLSMEFHRNTLTDTLASTRDLIDRVSHPALRSYWQPEPERTTEDWHEEIRKLGTRCSHVHVFHWLPGRVRRPLAEGEAVWRSLFPVLEHCGDRDKPRFAFLEHVMNDAPAQFAPDFRVLKALCAEHATC